MDYFFRTTDAAEDLPNAKAILVIHVLHRGYNMGAFVGVGSALVVTAVKAARGTEKALPMTNATAASAAPMLQSSPLTNRLVRFAARGSVYGVAFGALAVTGRMWGRELIEWQDRSWRLMHHATQTQTDHWSIVGAAVGASAGVVASKRLSTLRPAVVVAGAAGTGSVLAIVSMLAVRALVQSGTNTKAMR